MHQAQINAWGEAPKYTSAPELPTPSAEEVQIVVEAVGIHRVVRSRASGSHYSSGSIPHIPGVDGIGTTQDGQKVYFSTFAKGVLAERVNLPKSSIVALPEGADPIQVAALVNPAMSSWMALRARTTDLSNNFTCLILGATSASGKVAISLARAHGAGRIIGAARSQASLDTLGLDDTIVLADKAEETDFSNLDDVDVVLDYVYGPPALHLWKSLKTPKPVQYVHIGALSMQEEVSLPAQLLRSKDLTIRGAGPGSWRMKDFASWLPELLNAVVSIPKQPVKVAKLQDVESEWGYKGPDRLVFVP